MELVPTETLLYILGFLDVKSISLFGETCSFHSELVRDGRNRKFLPVTVVKEKKEKQQKSVFFQTTFPDGRVELTEKIWLLLNGEKTLVRVTSGSIANNKKDGIWETMSQSNGSELQPVMRKLYKEGRLVVSHSIGQEKGERDTVCAYFPHNKKMVDARSFVTEKKYIRKRDGQLVSCVFHCHNRDSFFVYYLREDIKNDGCAYGEIFAHCCAEHQKDMPGPLF